MSDAGPNFAEQPVRMTRWSARRGRIDIEIDGGAVYVSERLLGKTRRWSEPLSDYAGVQLNATLRPGSVLGMHRWHEVVLRHRDPEKTIPLHGSQRLADARRVWKAAAVTRKIRHAVPTKTAGRLLSEAATPIQISAKEMATIRARRKLPATVTRRMKGSMVGEKTETKRPSTKQVPKKKPYLTKRS